MKLSIVTTLYQSASYLNEFLTRSSLSAQNLVGEDYEIILVNDGSPDESCALAASMVAGNPHLVVVDLSRNFGHHQAMRAGLTYARGDFVFLIDSDLEESPEWITDFWMRLHQEKVDVVFGIQERRKGNLFEVWSGAIYYSILNTIANISHPRNITTARLMTRRYVKSLLLFTEREIVFSCLWIIAGYEQRAHAVTKLSRSKSTYTMSRKFAHVVNATTSFTAAPLKFIFFSGLVIFFFSSLYASYLVIDRFFFSHKLDGWTSIMASIWLLGGLIISFIGIIGIYVAKIFSESKGRPNFIVRETFGRENAPD